MLLPNLFIPGAAKSGTSSLHDYLQQHPKIFMSHVKEPHFFSNSTNFQDDQHKKLIAYSQLFNDSKGYHIRGESSTGYMVFPNVVQHIKNIIPDPKFIFVLRNPIDRAYSHYWWLRGRGYEIRSFREAILGDKDELVNSENRIRNIGSYRYYFAFGQYGKYLRPFFDEFGEEKIAIITSEQLKADAVNALNICFQFLGVDTIDRVFLKKTNATVVYNHPKLFKMIDSLGSQTFISRFLRRSLPDDLFQILVASRKYLSNNTGRLLKSKTSYAPISQEDRRWLYNLYYDDVNKLRSITGLPFAEWQDDFPVSVN